MVQFRSFFSLDIHFWYTFGELTFALPPCTCRVRCRLLSAESLDCIKSCLQGWEAVVWALGKVKQEQMGADTAQAGLCRGLSSSSEVLWKSETCWEDSACGWRCSLFWAERSKRRAAVFRLRRSRWLELWILPNLLDELVHIASSLFCCFL